MTDIRPCHDDEHSTILSIVNAVLGVGLDYQVEIAKH
jgi:hypothetical protein